jgi:cephalosporin hydroxylase
MASLLGYRARLLLHRLVLAIRPPARTIPLKVADILGSQHALSIVEQFNDLYFRSSVAGSLRWRGLEMIKNPCDPWVILDLMQELRPAVIIETGTHFGASATFYADMSAMLGLDTTVVTVDINPKWNFDPASKNTVSIVGVSTAGSVVDQVRAAVQCGLSRRSGPIMVMLDSDHTEENVSGELSLYAPFVTMGSYLVVEDTNVNGHPSSPEFGPGPFEAVQHFLAENPYFQADRSRERHLLTFNPNGWLRRVS